MGYVGQHELMQGAHLVLIGYLEVLASLGQVQSLRPKGQQLCIRATVSGRGHQDVALVMHSRLSLFLVVPAVESGQRHAFPAQLAAALTQLHLATCVSSTCALQDGQGAQEVMHQLQLQPSAAYATLSWARMFDVMKQYCALYSQPLAEQVGACCALALSCTPAVIAEDPWPRQHRFALGAACAGAKLRACHAWAASACRSEPLTSITGRAEQHLGRAPPRAHGARQRRGRAGSLRAPAGQRGVHGPRRPEGAAPGSLGAGGPGGAAVGAAVSAHVLPRAPGAHQVMTVCTACAPGARADEH